MRPRGPMPARGWLALACGALLVSAVIIGVLAAYGSPTAATTSTPVAATSVPEITAPLPDLGGPHSRLVPEMSLPVGARPYTGKPTPPGFEFWEVPGGRHDLVVQMRSELPTFAALNGMPWCGELNDAITSWAWGYPADTIGVSFIDGGVMITRLPQPHGCRP